MELIMKKLIVSTLAAAIALSFAMPAGAAGNKQKVSADVQASCKAQAAKKFSAVHFLKRRNFVNDCVAQHTHANTHAKAKPAVADKTDKPATTGTKPAQ